MIDRAPLEHEEALRLLKRVKLGDSQAQDILVEHNIALVKSIVKKYLNRGTEYDDLFQIGCVGLIKAVRNYDESFGVRSGLLKSKQFYSNAFQTAVNYDELMNLKRKLMK